MEMDSHILVLIVTNGDQFLAAEPGFHGDPLGGGGSVVTVVRRHS